MSRVEHLSEGVTVYLGDCREILPKLGVVSLAAAMAQAKSDGVSWACMGPKLRADYLRRPPFHHVLTDPPYEAIMHAAKSAAARRIRTDGRDELRTLDFASIDEIRTEVAEAIAASCSGWSIIFCAPEGVGRWADAINATTAKYKRACVWIKPDSTPQLNGQGPAMGAESFVVSWCGPGFARWNGGGKRGVYTYLTNPSDRDGGHPTEKPWRLFAELVRDFTQPGDIVCDPFMGSGTTGVACVKEGRGFVGVELEPRYFDIACKRISDELRRPRLQFEPVAKQVQEAMQL